MTKHNLVRSIVAGLLTATPFLVLSKNLFAQTKSNPRKTSERKISLSASFQYQNIPNRFDVRSYGLSFEYFLVDSSDYQKIDPESHSLYFDLSFSGPIYYGRGSNNLDYIHLSVGGSILVAYVAYASLYSQENLFAGISGLSAKNVLLFLITESINFNFHYGERFTVAPFISLFALDIAINQNESNEGDQKQIGNFLSSGLGMNLKMSLSERVTIVPYISYKYFYVSGEKKGYSAGMHLAFNL